MKGLYIIIDNKAVDAAGRIVALHGRDEVAVREFSDLLHDNNNTLGRHPEDYDLWCLGQLALDNGASVDNAEGRFIVNGKVLMDAQKEMTNNG